MTTIAMAFQTISLAGNAGIIEASGIFKVCIRSTSGPDLISQLRQCPTLPHLCIIGAKHEGIDNYTTMQQLRVLWPKLKTIVLTSVQSPLALMLMMHYGAQGYINLSCKQESLLQNLALVNDGYSCYPQDLSRQVNNMLKTRKRRRGICIFSKKELEVMHLLCGQYSAKQMADELRLCESTINMHLKHLYEKLNVSNKQELMACLYEAGFDICKKIIPSLKKNSRPFIVYRSATR